MAIPYVKQTWTDGSGGGTPISAARLGVIENGILDASLGPAVHVTHNAAQSTTSGTDLALAFNTERFDQVSGGASTMHDTATNNSRLTALFSGIYLITGNIQFASNATGARYAKIRLNGTTEIARTQIIASASDTHTICVSVPWPMAVNDYVELLALQSSGGALNVNSASSYSPNFSMVRVA